MLRGLMLVLTAVLLAAGNYINVYIEGGPLLSLGENIFVFDGRSWVPIEVVYVPEIIPTLVLATGEWVNMSFYRLDRYILKIPEEALGKTAQPPAGYAQWTLKTEDGKNTTLAVGPPMQIGDLQLGTWYRLAQTPITDYLRGVIETDQQRDPERDLGDQLREADEANAVFVEGGITSRTATIETGAKYIPLPEESLLTVGFVAAFGLVFIVLLVWMRRVSRVGS